MKSRLFLTCLLITVSLSACKKENEIKLNKIQKEELTESSAVENDSCTPCEEFRDYFIKNVSFFDERIRSINEISFVREILVIDLGDSGKLPKKYLYNDNMYFDNGEGLDEIAGDGIYTSINIYDFDASISFDPSKKVRSLMPNPRINPEFNREEELRAFAVSNDIRIDKNGNFPEPAMAPFSCHYTDGSGGFTGDADIDTVNALDDMASLDCYFLYA